MKLRYRIATRIVNYTWGLLFGFKVSGRENIPKTGGVIIASNHLSNYDPPLVGTAVYSRECFFFAKRELFLFSRWFTWLIRALNAYPVDTEKLDRKALMKTFDVLGKGRVLLFFPEGTRSKKGTFLSPNVGVGYIALKTHVSIVPTFVSGTNVSLWKLFLNRGKVYVKFGEPFSPEYLSQFENNKQGREKIAEEVMAAIKEMTKSE